MATWQEILDSLGVMTDDILLPQEGTDMTKWAVVACDQYTSEPEYWLRVEALVGQSPSTLRLIFPEVWLEREEDSRKRERIATINRTMADYLAQGLLRAHRGPLLTERTTRHGQRRLGLMLSLDLERYDFSAGSQSPIRATEGTIIERLPPRVRIRESASLELPHIMILIDDPQRAVIEPLHAACIAGAEPGHADTVHSSDAIRPVYDFPLMEHSGHVRGWTIADKGLLDGMAASLARLADPEAFARRYGTDGKTGVLLFAVGDGNHSLATAKTCWNRIREGLSEAARENHPARYALIELVNLHDDGLVFEPIHRVLFNADHDVFSRDFAAWHAKRGIRTRIEPAVGENVPADGEQTAVLISPQGRERLVWENPTQQLAVGSLQVFLDDWLASRPQTTIDYVHGDDVTAHHGAEPGNLGLLLPVMEKEALFPTVIRDGALPRKTFSMGEAHEKRFYLECRKIR